MAPTAIPLSLQQLDLAPHVQYPFNQLVRDWQSCHACPLAARRSRVIFARGQMPANVCFIGEAPGRSEDTAGFPFVGRAGVVLEDWITNTRKRLGRTLGPRLTYSVINVVGCLPEALDEDGGWEIRAPTKDEASLCMPRTKELVRLTNPRCLILLGKTALKFNDPDWDIPTFSVWHPAYVLRQGGVTSPASKEVILRLTHYLRPFLRKDYRP